MAILSETELLQIRDRHEGWLRTQPGVVGTGVGLTESGAIALKVYSDGMPPAIRRAILERLEGIPVAIEETGEPRLLK